MPRYYTWKASSIKFQHRKQGDVFPGHPGVRSTEVLGRIYIVHPKNDECFYLRLLLVNVRGPTSFEPLRTANGVVLPIFRAAFHNLLKSDTHWDTTATVFASPSQTRTLFEITISKCFPLNQREQWDKYKDDISEDILHGIHVQSVK